MRQKIFLLIAAALVAVQMSGCIVYGGPYHYGYYHHYGWYR